MKKILHHLMKGWAYKVETLLKKEIDMNEIVQSKKN